MKQPFWEIPRPYQPTSKTFDSRVIGSTNPIWIDGDGDGQFLCAHAIARSLVQRFGKDTAKLKDTAKGYDAAVGVQLESMLSEP